MPRRFDWRTTTIETLRLVEDDVEKNPYKYLDLPDDAPIDQVRRMYRRLMKKYHPEVQTIERMRDPVLAYERAVQINRAYGAIKIMKGTKEEWEKPQYEWRVKTEFEFVDGKYQDVDTGERVIDLESSDGEIFRQDFVPDLRTGIIPLYSLFPQIKEVDEAIHKQDKHLYSFSPNNIKLAFGYPDESFEVGFGLGVSLASLFVYLARKQGISVAPTIVKPFLDFHKLYDVDAKGFADAITSANASRRGMKTIIKRFGINEILNSRKPDAAKVNEFEYDLFHLMDIARCWSDGRLGPTFINSAGVLDDGSLAICWGYNIFGYLPHRMEVEEFTKNDLNLMIRLAYGDNLLPPPAEGSRAVTYDIRKLGTDNAVVEKFEPDKRKWTAKELLFEEAWAILGEQLNRERIKEERKFDAFENSKIPEIC